MIRFSADDLFLVTGASSGFGAASALLLNSLGASVVAVGRNEAQLAALQKDSAAPERWHSESKDLTKDPDGLAGWVKELRERHGKFKGLLYCAGVCRVVPTRMQEAQDMRDLFEINVFAAYQVARGFLDRRNNIGAGASAVLIASTGALHDNAGITSYSASKGATISLMRSLACEFVPQKIRVNAISPALVPTPMTAAIYPDLEQRAATYPLGPGSPADVANTATFLLSDASRWITGQNIIVDGGIGLG